MAAKSSINGPNHRHPAVETRLYREAMSQWDLPAAGTDGRLLLAAGHTREAGWSEATRSVRRRDSLRWVSEAYRITGVLDLNPHRPIVAMGDRSGNVLGQVRLNLEGLDTHRLLEMLLCTVRLLRQSLDPERAPLAELVVAVPDGSGSRAGSSWIPDTPCFFPLLWEALTREFSVPVIRQSCAGMAALGEYRAGGSRRCESMVYLSCNRQVEAALIRGGRLCEEESLTRGIMGGVAHRMEDGTGEHPDRNLTLESLRLRLEGAAAAGKAGEVLNGLYRATGQLEPEDLEVAVHAGDRLTLEHLDRLAVRLGAMTVTIHSLAGAGLMVLGGDYLRFYPRIAPVVKGIMLRHISAPPLLMPGRLGDSAGVHGGIALGRESLTSQVGR